MELAFPFCFWILHLNCITKQGSAAMTYPSMNVQSFSLALSRVCCLAVYPLQRTFLSTTVIGHILYQLYPIILSLRYKNMMHHILLPKGIILNGIPWISASLPCQYSLQLPLIQAYADPASLEKQKALSPLL